MALWAPSCKEADTVDPRMKRGAMAVIKAEKNNRRGNLSPYVFVMCVHEDGKHVEGYRTDSHKDPLRVQVENLEVFEIEELEVVSDAPD